MRGEREIRNIKDGSTLGSNPTDPSVGEMRASKKAAGRISIADGHTTSRHCLPDVRSGYGRAVAVFRGPVQAGMSAAPQCHTVHGHHTSLFNTGFRSLSCS